MRKPSLLTLYTLNAINFVITEIYVRFTLRNTSLQCKSDTRAIAADVRKLRLQRRHTDPYNAHLHKPTHNLFTLEYAKRHIDMLLER